MVIYAWHTSFQGHRFLPWVYFSVQFTRLLSHIQRVCSNRSRFLASAKLTTFRT
jgi:hypothetical protein